MSASSQGFESLPLRHARAGNYLPALFLALLVPFYAERQEEQVPRGMNVLLLLKVFVDQHIDLDRFWNMLPNRVVKLGIGTDSGCLFSGDMIR